MKSVVLVLALSCAAFAQMSQTNFSGSRSLSTVYQNTTGRMTLQTITVEAGSCGFHCNADVTANVLVDTANPPLVTVAQKYTFTGVGGDLALTVAVPPNAYFKVTATSVNGAPLSVPLWVEWSLEQITTATQSAPARSLGTTYQNATSNTIWVEAIVQTTATAVCDSNASPTTTVAQEDTVSTQPVSLFFPVLPNYYYKITGSSLVGWEEVSSTTPLNMTQNVVTGSRAASNPPTVYQAQNQAILASVVLQEGNAQFAGSFQGDNDTANPPGKIIVNMTRQQFQNGQLFWANPVSQFYQVAFDNPASLQEWIEWDIPVVVTSFAGEPRRRTVN